MPTRLISARLSEMEAAAGEARNHSGDAIDSSYADMRAMRVESNDCLRVGVQFADFGGINGACCALTNLHQTQGSSGIHHTRVNK